VRRLVAALVARHYSTNKTLRQVAVFQSADKSAHSKEQSADKSAHSTEKKGRACLNARPRQRDQAGIRIQPLRVETLVTLIFLGGSECRLQAEPQTAGAPPEGGTPNTSVCLVSSCVPAIMSKVANVAAPITDICAKIAAITADFPCVGPDLHPICPQFCRGSTFAPILTKLADVASALANVLVNFPPVAADISSISPHFSTIGTQLSALAPVDMSAPLRRCGSKQRQH